MTSRRFHAAVLAGVALVAVVACGGPEAKAPVSITSQAVAPKAQPSPTAPKVVTPAPLTREQAAQLYLALARPINAVFEEPKCKSAEEFLVEGGTWPPDGHNEYGEHADRVLQDCHKRLVPMYETSIKAFQTTLWPVDARADVADLISQDQAFLYCLKKTSKATNSNAMYKALECFAEDDGSADRVRARFGLPGRAS